MITKVPFPSLFTEMTDYAERIVMEDKVNRVYGKCIKSGRYELADKIRKKYYRYIFKSDFVIAMEMSLWALAKNK